MEKSKLPTKVASLGKTDFCLIRLNCNCCKLANVPGIVVKLLTFFVFNIRQVLKDVFCIQSETYIETMVTYLDLPVNHFSGI